MNWWHNLKSKYKKPAEKICKEPFELEMYLDEQINNGDFKGSQRTLKKLGRHLLRTEKLTLLNKCIETKKFSEALYLAGGFPYSREIEVILKTIVREAAFVNDLNSARHAALLSERMSSMDRT